MRIKKFENNTRSTTTELNVEIFLDNENSNCYYIYFDNDSNYNKLSVYGEYSMVTKKLIGFSVELRSNKATLTKVFNLYCDGTELKGNFKSFDRIKNLVELLKLI